MTSEKDSLNPFDVEIGKRIQELRQCNVAWKKYNEELGRHDNLTQELLASQMNISHRHMAHIETGRRGLTPEKAIVVAEIFQVSMDYIYRGTIVSSDMHPICKLVYDTLALIQNEENRGMYSSTIVSLSKLLQSCDA